LPSVTGWPASGGLGPLSPLKRKKPVLIFSTGQRPNGGDRSEIASYYATVLIVKAANKRLLKTMGFVIRGPILNGWNQKQNITTKITKNTKKNLIKSFLNFVPFVVYITGFRVAARITYGIPVNISKRSNGGCTWQ
jgi:hypothetical protein